MTKIYEYEYPLPMGDPDLGAEADVVFVYTVNWGSPAVIYQRNGDPGWPADPDEIELVRVDVKGVQRQSNGKYRIWTSEYLTEEAAIDFFENDEDEDLYNLLIENARETDAADRDEAMERRGEERREMRKLDNN